MENVVEQLIGENHLQGIELRPRWTEFGFVQEMLRIPDRTHPMGQLASSIAGKLACSFPAGPLEAVGVGSRV